MMSREIALTVSNNTRYAMVFMYPWTSYSRHGFGFVRRSATNHDLSIPPTNPPKHTHRRSHTHAQHIHAWLFSGLEKNASAIAFTVYVRVCVMVSSVYFIGVYVWYYMYASDYWEGGGECMVQVLAGVEFVVWWKPVCGSKWVNTEVLCILPRVLCWFDTLYSICVCV